MVLILILLCLLFIAILGFTICEYIISRRKDRTEISFKEGLDLTEVPVATFYCGDVKLHFLLDTGSSISFIDKAILKDIPSERLNIKSNTIGVEGSGVETEHYRLTIGYKDNLFTEEFGAIDFTSSFDSVESETGIRLHGILGSKFFEKYKYILDFKELTAYR